MVLDVFSPVHIQLLSLVHSRILPPAGAPAPSPASRAANLESLLLLLKLFHSLTAQECPDGYLEHLPTFFSPPAGLLLRYLALPAAPGAGEEEEELMRRIKATVCEIVGMFVVRYEEDFEKYVEGFVSGVWELMMGASTDIKNDGVRIFRFLLFFFLLGFGSGFCLCLPTKGFFYFLL
jgi:exportin-2 (importin alpha re-exporter)